VSNSSFRQFVIGVTGYAKQEEITGFFTNTRAVHGAALHYGVPHFHHYRHNFDVAVCGSTRGNVPALNVFKMRGSWHDKGIREYQITDGGPDIKDSFRNLERVISGSPTRIAIDEKSELSRIVQGVQDEEM
jgi:circadian clock protein KaiC